MSRVLGIFRRFLQPSAHSDAVADDRYDVLDSLRREHTLITVHAPRLARSYQSIILQLEADASTLIIDELFPAEGRNLLVPGDTLEVIARGDCSLRFYSRLLERRPTLNTTVYVLELPDEIGAAHRRRSYRVYVELEHGLRLSVNDPEGEPISAQLVNLSADGVKLSLPAVAQRWAAPHHHFDPAVITLPGGYQLDVAIELLNLYPLRSPRPLLLAGGKLTIASAVHRTRLEQYLAALQRRQRRRASGVA